MLYWIMGLQALEKESLDFHGLGWASVADEPVRPGLCLSG